MLDDVLAIPDHLRDALWRVDSARLEATGSDGLLVCGMGGSAIGGDLAAAAIGARLRAPMLTVRGYHLPAGVGAGWTAACSSYSGGTEETLACFRSATEAGIRRVVVSTGGELVELAREDDVQVVGLPGILQPRAAVAYMFVTAVEIAAKAGVAPSLRAEIEAAADFLDQRLAELQQLAGEIGERLAGTVPVVYGAELTAPVARRWKTQINENAKAPAFYAELPEADHNEICGWDGAPDGTRISAAMLGDEQHGAPLRRRFELTAEEIRAGGSEVVSVQTEGESPTARLLYATMLGDLVSLELAAARGVDPLPVEAIGRLKSALSSD